MIAHCYSCCAIVCASCAASSHSDHYIVTADTAPGSFTSCEDEACASASFSGAVNNEGGTDADMAAAPIVAGIALLFIAGSSDAGADPVGNALSGVTDDEGLVSLDHLQTLWRSRLHISQSLPPPPPQYAVLRGVLRSGLFSTARVSGSRARVGLSHPRAHEVAALAALPTRALLSEGIDIAPLVTGSVLSERILTVLATSQGPLWDPRDEVVTTPLLPRKSAMPPLRLSAALISTPPHLMAQRIAALAGVFFNMPTTAQPKTPSTFSVLPRRPVSETATVAARPTITVTTVPDLVRCIQRLMLRVDANTTGGNAVSIIASGSSNNSSSSGSSSTADGTAPLPDYLGLATVDEIILLDINAMSRDATARRQVIPGGTDVIDDESTSTTTTTTTISALVLFFPLLPLFFDARITKIVFDGSREVGLFATAGVRIVNLFVLRVALEELGLSRTRAPTSDVDLLNVLLANHQIEGKCISFTNDTPAQLAGGLLDAARAASAALFLPHNKIATTASPSTPSGAIELQRTIALFSPPVSPVSELALYRAELRSQLLSLAAPAGLPSGTSVAGLKRGRLAIDAPLQVIPPWWYRCRTCNLRGNHFAYDCGEC